jgi:hypothetical protein
LSDLMTNRSGLASSQQVRSPVWAARGSEDTELGVLWSRRWVIERRKFTREFKFEAVKLVKGSWGVVRPAGLVDSPE